MKFELNLRRQNVEDKELLDDLVRVYKMVHSNLTKKVYNEHGKYYSSTFEKRFGSWNKAKRKAGIDDIHKVNISVQDLFQNIENIWTSLGRQPKSDEIKKPLSAFSIMPYKNKFGSWNNALSEFIKYVESDQDYILKGKGDKNPPISKNSFEKKPVHKTKREISDRLRFRVLMRDGFACQSCGRSPQSERGVELHVDHIIPYSKGGETILENLQTKCRRCNLGKGNAFSK